MPLYRDLHTYNVLHLETGYFFQALCINIFAACIRHLLGLTIYYVPSLTTVSHSATKHSQIDLSGTDVSIYESAGVMVAVWLHDQYAFSLTVYGDYGIDLMIKLIDSVQRQ